MSLPVEFVDRGDPLWNLSVHQLIATLLLSSLLLAGCVEPSDHEAIIRANVNQMETALADLDNSGFMDHLAESFNGGKSGQADLDRKQAQKMLALYFLRYRRVQILVTQLAIEQDLYQPDLATSTATVALSGGEGLIPNSAGLYKVAGQWQNFGGTWKLTRLEWD